MNMEDANDYFIPAARNIFVGDHNAEQKCQLLEKQLGCKMWSDFIHRERWKDFPIADDMREVLLLLQGPYAKTILRAYQIKHGIEVEHDF